MKYDDIMAPAVDERKFFMGLVRRPARSVISMENRLNDLIAGRRLDVPPGEIFKFYGLPDLEKIAVEIVCLFLRYSPLLSTYECICAWVLKRAGEKLRDDELAEVVSLQAAIQISRHKYVDGFGRAVAHAFYEQILLENQMTGRIDDLDSLLIRFFIAVYPSGDAAAGRLRRQDVICGVGERCDRPQEAQKLADAADAIELIPLCDPQETAGEQDQSEMENVAADINVKLERLKKDLDQIIRKCELEKTETELFKKYGFSRIETLITPVQYHFSRASLLLSCYEAELKLAALQRGLPKMPSVVKDRYSALMDVIAGMRKTYIDQVGTRVLGGLLRCIRTNSALDQSGAGNGEDAGIGWFDIGLPNPCGIDCPDFYECELDALLTDVGEMTGTQSEAEILRSCIKTGAGLEAGSTVR